MDGFLICMIIKSTLSTLCYRRDLLSTHLSWSTTQCGHMLCRFVGNLLKGQTVGVIGAGRIGSAYARMMVMVKILSISIWSTEHYPEFSQNINRLIDQWLWLILSGKSLFSGLIFSVPHKCMIITYKEAFFSLSTLFLMCITAVTGWRIQDEPYVLRSLPSNPSWKVCDRHVM